MEKTEVYKPTVQRVDVDAQQRHEMACGACHPPLIETHATVRAVLLRCENAMKYHLLAFCLSATAVMPSL